MGEETKRKLIDVRAECHFDIPKTARDAKLPPMIVRDMLNYLPVKKEYAKAVLQVLSTTDRPLSFENVDVALEQE